MADHGCCQIPVHRPPPALDKAILPPLSLRFMRIAGHLLLGFGVLVAVSCRTPDASVSQDVQPSLCTKPSDLPLQAGSINSSSALDRVDLLQNKPETIRLELADDHFLPELGRLLGYSPADISKLRFQYDTEDGSVDYEDYGAPSGVAEAVCQAVSQYVNWRTQGHTRTFVMMVFRERGRELHVPGVMLKRPLEEESHIPIPVSLLQLQKDAGSWIVDEQEVKSVIYAAVDGEIARTYEFIPRPDGSLRRLSTEVVDAKDYDPKLRGVIDEIEKKVAARMKTERISGLGSCHVFWGWKKEMLKERGIQWRSPSELNRNTCYD